MDIYMEYEELFIDWLETLPDNFVVEGKPSMSGTDRHRERRRLQAEHPDKKDVPSGLSLMERMERDCMSWQDYWKLAMAERYVERYYLTMPSGSMEQFLRMPDIQRATWVKDNEIILRVQMKFKELSKVFLFSQSAPLRDDRRRDQDMETLRLYLLDTYLLIKKKRDRFSKISYFIGRNYHHVLWHLYKSPQSKKNLMDWKIDNAWKLLIARACSDSDLSILEHLSVKERNRILMTLLLFKLRDIFDAWFDDWAHILDNVFPYDQRDEPSRNARLLPMLRYLFLLNRRS